LGIQFHPWMTWTGWSRSNNCCPPWWWYYLFMVLLRYFSDAGARTCIFFLGRGVLILRHEFCTSSSGTTNFRN
jgi:hypothetical protein